jgi:ribosome-binding ATPase YchF (GTP1/OBG family)
VGKTNVGKSTFFAAATTVEVSVENRPFVTIDPNVGIAYVRRKCVHEELRLPKCDPIDGFCKRGWRYIGLKLIDVAGLVPGAAEGRGLGTQFLDAVRRADALLIVVDASGSTDDEGNPVPPGTHDPSKDVQILLDEFSKWIFNQIIKDWKSFSMKADTSSKTVEEMLAYRLSGFSVKKEHIVKALEELDLPSRLSKWKKEDLKNFVRKIVELRPKVIVANKADIEGAERGVEILKTKYKYPVIPTSAVAELILRKASMKGYIDYLPGDSDFKILKELDPKQRRILEMVREKVLEKWGSTGVVQALNTAVFEQLGMVVVYPVYDQTRYTDSEGRVLPEARLVPKNTNLKEFASKIHTELAKGFIYAIDVKSGKRLGAEHLVEDNMVVKIVSAASRG